MYFSLPHHPHGMIFIKSLVAKSRLLSNMARNTIFMKNFIKKRDKLSDNRFVCRWKDRRPCLYDKTAATSFDAHYVFHTAWATRIIKQLAPHKHIDIGSSLYFVTQLSAFIPVEFYDYRPADIKLDGLYCHHGDILALPFSDNSVASLSSLHVVEHIGLERYGDPFDPQGDLKAMRELERVLAPGGSLLFVVPLGETARIQYNAHRIYTYDQIISCFPSLTLHNFALIADSGHFTENASPSLLDNQKYACGCFCFKKEVLLR